MAVATTWLTILVGATIMVAPAGAFSINPLNARRWATVRVGGRVCRCIVCVDVILLQSCDPAQAEEVPVTATGAADLAACLQYGSMSL